MEGDRRSVLVVDDDGMVLMGLTMVLENWGFTVIGARSLGEARDRLVEALPELVLTDLYLHGNGGGFEVVDHVRAAVGRAVPAIILTGATAQDELDEIARRGLSYLLKPIQPMALLAALRTALDWR